MRQSIEMTVAELHAYLDSYSRLPSGLDQKIAIDIAISMLDDREKFVVVVKLICGCPECGYWLGKSDYVVGKIEEAAISRMSLYLNKEEKI